MGKLVKYGVLLAFVLAVLSVVTSLMLAVKEMKNQKLSVGNEQQVNKISNMQKTLREKIKEFDKVTAEKQNLQTTVKSITAKLNKAQEELDSANEVLQEKVMEVEKLQEQNKTLAGSDSAEGSKELFDQLESAKSKATQIEERLKKVDASKDELKGRVNELSFLLNTKEDELLTAKQRESDLLTTVNDLKTRVSELTDFRAQNLNAGRKREAPIEVVNREMKFIVFGIGQNDGLSEGEVLKVYRDEKYLGTVLVDEVFQSMAAATISDDGLTRNITEGDIVRR